MLTGIPGSQRKNRVRGQRAILHFKHVVFKITFPNGKIDIGKDIGGEGHSLRYFGSWDNEAVAADFTKAELSNFSIQKEIIFESESKDEVGRVERKLIAELRSNDPALGYNRNK